MVRGEGHNHGGVEDCGIGGLGGIVMSVVIELIVVDVLLISVFIFERFVFARCRPHPREDQSDCFHH